MVPVREADTEERAVYRCLYCSWESAGGPSLLSCERVSIKYTRFVDTSENKIEGYLTLLVSQTAGIRLWVSVKHLEIIVIVAVSV